MTDGVEEKPLDSAPAPPLEPAPAPPVPAQPTPPSPVLASSVAAPSVASPVAAPPVSVQPAPASSVSALPVEPPVPLRPAPPRKPTWREKGWLRRRQDPAEGAPDRGMADDVGEALDPAPAPVAPAPPVPARSKLTWREKRWQRRRRRKLFEEVLGWILVPVIVVALYWAVKGGLNAAGTSPTAVYQAVKTLISGGGAQP